MAANRKKSSPPAMKQSGFLAKNGYDLMSGPKISTRPATLKPPFVPGTGMGLGMEKRP